jgi:DNA-directed RNA polymerase specialized sigma24 family protein
MKVGFGLGRSDDDRERFIAFARDSEPKLRRALVAAYGAERGREGTAEALAYAWEHWDRVKEMANPNGYLYRVGQSRSRPRRRPPLFAVEYGGGDPMVEPGLIRAMSELTESQRVCVVLTQAYGWQLNEVAELIGTSISTVQTHTQRGMDKLRNALEVDLAGDR